MVEQALGTGDKDEAIALAMKWELDQYLNDPSIVLKMIDYAQEKGKSALTVLAMSKRFATLINEPTYFNALSNIENRLIHDKHEAINTTHAWTNAIKSMVQSRVKQQVS